MRLGQRHAITADGLREQAEQLGLLDTAEVIVLAPTAYANLAIQVWPDAQLPLRDTRGIGDQMARFAGLAAGRTTVTALLSTPGPRPPVVTPAATSDQDSVRPGEHHPAESPLSTADTFAQTGTPDDRARRRHAASKPPRSRLDQVRVVAGCRPARGWSRCRPERSSRAPPTTVPGPRPSRRGRAASTRPAGSTLPGSARSWRSTPGAPARRPRPDRW
jgi:hypothetical protein